jgi:hypothetical protein
VEGVSREDLRAGEFAGNDVCPRGASWAIQGKFAVQMHTRRRISPHPRALIAGNFAAVRI